LANTKLHFQFVTILWYCKPFTDS